VDQNSDRKAASLPQTARQDIGPVVEFAGRRQDTLPGLRWNFAGRGRVIEDDGDGGRGEIQVFGQKLQTDGLSGLMRRLASAGQSWRPW
jgi:hypothetical protein